MRLAQQVGVCWLCLCQAASTLCANSKAMAQPCSYPQRNQEKSGMSSPVGVCGAAKSRKLPCSAPGPDPHTPQTPSLHLLCHKMRTGLPGMALWEMWMAQMGKGSAVLTGKFPHPLGSPSSISCFHEQGSSGTCT